MSASSPSSSTTCKHPVACSLARLPRAVTMGVVVRSPLSTGNLPPSKRQLRRGTWMQEPMNSAPLASAAEGGALSHLVEHPGVSGVSDRYQFVPACPLAWHHGAGTDRDRPDRRRSAPVCLPGLGQSD